MFPAEDVSISMAGQVHPISYGVSRPAIRLYEALLLVAVSSLANYLLGRT